MLFSKYCPGVTTLGVTFFLSLSYSYALLRILGQGRFSPAMFFNKHKQKGSSQAEVKTKKQKKNHEFQIHRDVK